MYEPTAYEITTPHTYLPPQTPAVRPVLLPADIPPGVNWVTLPNGVRTLAYTHPTAPPQIPVTAPQPIPAWAKTTALLAPTIGGGIGAAGIGLSYAAPGLIAMTHALWSAAALVVATVIAIPVLIRTARRATGNGGEGSVRTTTHITQNITATGLFGRANGTINHR
ncbi:MULTISPECIES: hypothetical protein [Streptomyces]|uniref:Uncharacterized protein n=1 Tax=Streptomyces venezuelae TaxID=54571 RepID=A0A5P2AS95_STRVZ|nr:MULTISPECIES: hypothetical protein [Streptomyces]QES20975.1 hypothetical protein DEJ46_19210 [Streptomyces venezuelae]GGW02343.1 hypothetical protein GCM10010230_35170 [Streptomyces narbonensis]